MEKKTTDEVKAIIISLLTEHKNAGPIHVRPIYSLKVGNGGDKK